MTLRSCPGRLEKEDSKALAADLQTLAFVASAEASVVVNHHLLMVQAYWNSVELVSSFSCILCKRKRLAESLFSQTIGRKDVKSRICTLTFLNCTPIL